MPPINSSSSSKETTERKTESWPFMEHEFLVSLSLISGFWLSFLYGSYFKRINLPSSLLLKYAFNKLFRPLNERKTEISLKQITKKEEQRWWPTVDYMDSKVKDVFGCGRNKLFNKLIVGILFLVTIVNVDGQRSMTFKKGFEYIHIKAKCCPLLL